MTRPRIELTTYRARGGHVTNWANPTRFTQMDYDKSLINHCIFLGVCRQYSSAQADLMEAFKIAPNNRELRRLLVRVKEECREQALYENAGSCVSLQEVDHPSAEEDRHGNDSVTNMSDHSREETAL